MKLSNAKVQEVIVSVPGALEALKEMGWVEASALCVGSLCM